MDISLVIPAYNESVILPDTLRAVSSKLAELTDRYEVLVVDDGSTDGTAEVVRRWDDPHVRLERYTPNQGKGRAVRVGMLAASGDIILCTDADLAYGVEVFSTILERFAAGEAALVSGLPYDTQCGIKGYRREAARAIYSRCTVNGFSFDFEALMWADKLGLRVEQIPVSVVNFRESKVNLLQDSCRMFRDLFRIRRTVRREKA